MLPKSRRANWLSKGTSKCVYRKVSHEWVKFWDLDEVRIIVEVLIVGLVDDKALVIELLEVLVIAVAVVKVVDKVVEEEEVIVVAVVIGAVEEEVVVDEEAVEVVIVVINGLVLKVSLVEVKVVKDVVVGRVKEVFDIRDDEVAKYKGLTPLVPMKKAND